MKIFCHRKAIRTSHRPNQREVETASPYTTPICYPDLGKIDLVGNAEDPSTDRGHVVLELTFEEVRQLVEKMREKGVKV